MPFKLFPLLNNLFIQPLYFDSPSKSTSSNETMTPTPSLLPTPLQTEFAISSLPASTQKITQILSSLPGINSFEIHPDKSSVSILATTRPSEIFSTLIKESGSNIILRGMSSTESDMGAAVCIFEHYPDLSTNKNQWAQYDNKGLARLLQLDEKTLVVDIGVHGVLKTETPRWYSVTVHECGDISRGVGSVGDVFGGDGGVLGCVKVHGSGVGEGVLEVESVRIWEVVGRAIVVQPLDLDVDGNVDMNERYAVQNALKEKLKAQGYKMELDAKTAVCGVIARSAGVFENKKMVCTCSGRTLWEEAVA